MGSPSIDRLIVNSPYDEPVRYWSYDHKTRLFNLIDGRRPAGYVIASSDSQTYDDPGVFIDIPLVNRIRSRVKEWRNNGYPGVSSITRRLLEYWTDPEEFETRRFFFCQIEAAETFIWLTEAPKVDSVGLDIPRDGGTYSRLCAKMATGTGKTVVMAMVIAWHILNKIAYPQDTRFSKYVFVIAPGLTVKRRLSVLDPMATENFFETFRIVPSAMLEQLRQGKVVIRNWHALNWETNEKILNKRSVDKRGAKGDEAYVRDVLGDIFRARNILVVNDEAHHAWRVPSVPKQRGVSKANIEEATKWVGGLDRIDRARGILGCYDFSATPFVPSGRLNSEDALFGWIVSDFGLNDAIESGLVKTPRVVIRDDAVPDAQTFKSRLYHIYNDPEVKDDLNRRARPHEPLPSLVSNAYLLLGLDWRETKQSWESQGVSEPPVMITVANRTETAARVKYAFDHQKILIDELCNSARTLHIDSSVLASAESAEEPIAKLSESEVHKEKSGCSERGLTIKQRAELLRLQVDTVGKPGRPGWHIQNVISVGMLSEGWDAQTVTHIMGLRAFASQLLCEQVVGRGLRRTTYDINPSTGQFEPEYVNIFGVPFTFLPHEGSDSVPPPPPLPKTGIEPVAEKEQYAIRWPNVVRINHGYKTRLSLDWRVLQPLELDASKTASLAELAPIVDGMPDATKIEEIELIRLAREFRTQRIVFEVVRDVYEQMQPDWQGSKYSLLGQLVKLIEQFIVWKRLTVKPAIFNNENLKRRLVLTLNMDKLVRHIWDAIRLENIDTMEPILDQNHPIGSTYDMRTWFTGKPCERATHCHINYCVFDSSWEASEAYALAHSSHVKAWVKNDHLGFDVFYVHGGVVHRYHPDFLVRLSSGDMLVVETKGREREKDKSKRRSLDEWVRAVNSHGGFGHWHWAVSRTPADIHDILASHASEDEES